MPTEILKDIVIKGLPAFNINDIINSSYKGIYLRVKNTSGNIIFQKIELEEGYK